MTTDDDRKFVGRDDELGIFHNILSNPDEAKRIMLILGGGGLEKPTWSERCSMLQKKSLNSLLRMN